MGHKKLGYVSNDRFQASDSSLLFAGGQQGKGVVFNNRTHRQTFMKMVGVQAGLGFGVAKTRLIFIFETASALQSFINQILSTQADQICGADYATTSQSRTNTRNGYRHRDLDTRVGTIDVAIPKLRQGTYFPEWLLERRKRAETALITVVAAPGTKLPAAS